MTRQEMFNKAYIGVILQGGPSVTSDADGSLSCAYLDGDTGRKCGVGHLLTDEELADVGSLKGSVFCLREEWYQISTKPIPAWLNTSHMSFLSNLQDAHDEAYYRDGADYITHFLKEMDKVAKDYELTVPKGWEIVQAKHRECELEI